VKGWLFPYGIWYALAAAVAASAAGAGVRGDVLNAVLDGIPAAAICVLALRSQVRWSRSGEKALRAELVEERSRSGAPAWLHRDAGLLFTPDRRRVAGMPEQSLMVMDEDLLRDVNDARVAGGGKVAATYTSYRAHPVFPQVMRQPDGLTALVTPGDVEQAEPGRRESWWQQYAGMVRTMRAGLAFADAGELAEVVAQFRDAEPISPDA